MPNRGKRRGLAYTGPFRGNEQLPARMTGVGMLASHGLKGTTRFHLLDNGGLVHSCGGARLKLRQTIRLHGGLFARADHFLVSTQVMNFWSPAMLSRHQTRLAEVTIGRPRSVSIVMCKRIARWDRF